MLLLNRLIEYTEECKNELFDDEEKPMFNYCTMVLDNEELAKVLQERKKNENTFLIAVMPDYAMNGEEDNAKWRNMLQFMILDKTDYSDLKRSEYLNVFVTTQLKARAIVDKILEDKSNLDGMFCGFLSWLREGSIIVSPVKQHQGCKGWSIEINLDTPL